MRVIVDTNVFVSGLISPHGAPARILSSWLDGDFALLYSPEMFVEMEDVLNRLWLKKQMAYLPNRIQEFLDAVTVLGELVQGYVDVAGLTRDPFDEMFLVCAAAGQADFIVTGDKDLLVLGEFRGASIVTPAQFLEILPDKHGAHSLSPKPPPTPSNTT